jgi:hypothetical protein
MQFRDCTCNFENNLGAIERNDAITETQRKLANGNAHIRIFFTFFSNDVSRRAKMVRKKIHTLNIWMFSLEG